METTLKWLNPNDIVKDWSMNPRDRDEDHIRTIARHMNDNGYDHNFPSDMLQHHRRLSPK